MARSSTFLFGGDHRCAKKDVVVKRFHWWEFLELPLFRTVDQNGGQTNSKIYVSIAAVFTSEQKHFSDSTNSLFFFGSFFFSFCRLDALDTLPYQCQWILKFLPIATLKVKVDWIRTISLLVKGSTSVFFAAHMKKVESLHFAYPLYAGQY